MAQKLTKVAEVTDLESTDTIVVIDESVQNPDGSSGAVRRIKRSNMGINSKADYITVNGVKYPITSITKTTVGTKNLPSLVIAYDDGEGSTIVLPDATAMGIVSEDIYSEVRTKVSGIKVNGVTQDKDASGVVNLTISDDTKADAIVKSASGSIASFTDGGDNLPMKSLKVNIVPKQSGTGDPSPSNARAISGWDSVDVLHTGKNIFDSQRLLNANGWTKDGDEYKGNVGNLYAYNEDVGLFPIKGDASKQYALSFKGRNDSSNTASMSLGFKYSDGTESLSAWMASTSYEEKTAISTVGKTVVGIVVGYANGGNVHLKDIQIEVGSTATAYEPYQAETITTNLGQTVYGGALDVVSGKLVIDRKGVGLGALNWDKNVGNYSTFTSNGISADAMIGSSEVTTQCSIYKSVSFDASSPSDDLYVFVNRYSTLVIKDTTKNDMTVAQFKTAMNGQTLVYELATPIELTLTPTEVKSLLGANNVWSESGTVEVEYRADTTLAYNELLSLIASLS